MHIAMFSDSYLPYVSGVVRSIEIFTRELRSRGHTVSIFAPAYPNQGPDEPGVYRVPSIRTPYHREFTLAIPFSPQLARQVRELGVDVIHVHSPFIMGRVGARAARQLGLPLVFTHHTLYDQYVHYVPVAPPALTRRLTIRVVTAFANRCHQVIAPSRTVAERIRAQGITAPVRVIPTGIQTDRLASGDPGWLARTWGIPAGEPVLIYVGRLAKEKNLDFLLEAFAQVRQRVPRAWLVFVAGGPERAHLEARARELGIGPRLIMTGVLPYERVIDAYAGADLFVFASQTETQGMVIGEAMAAGLPVVAVAASGVTDLVRDGVDGYLTPHQLAPFVERVVELLEHPEQRRQMGAEARRQAETISVARTTDALLEVYAAAEASLRQAATSSA